MTPRIAFPLRYCPLVYAGLCALSLFTVLMIAHRAHFHGLVQTHCTEGALTAKQESSFRNWRFDVEYWPSISATMGDNMPERAIWRVTLPLILPFFASGYFHLIQMYRKMEGPNRRGFRLSDALAVCVVAKMVFCFGYTYVASFEALIFHEASFGAYIVFGFALQVIQVILTRRYKHLIPEGKGDMSLKTKYLGIIGQTTCIAGFVRFFVMGHLAACVPGSYSRGNMFEWMFAFFNLAFDATVYFDLGDGTIVFTSEKNADDDTAAGIVEPITWRRPASDTLLWLAELGYAYFVVASFLQMGQQAYFIPMVAMKFTPEAISTVTSPLLVLLVGRLPPVRAVFHRCDAQLRNVLKVQRGVAILACAATITCHHTDILESAGLKLVFAAIGPHVLFTVNRLRGLLLSTKLATIAKARETHSNAALDALHRSTVLEQHRLVYGLGFGFAINMLVRYLGVSVDIFLVDPTYSVITMMVLIGLQVVGPVRHYSYELHIFKDDVQVSPGQLPTATGSIGYGLLFGVMLTIASSHGTTARYVGLDPVQDWWTPLVPICAVVGGLWASPHLKFSTPIRGSSTPKVAAVLMLSTAALYYGTTQSNRWFQRDASVLENWEMEQMSGSPIFAFICGGAVLQFALGALIPHVCCWNFCVCADAVTGRVDEYAYIVAPPRTDAPKQMFFLEVYSFAAIIATSFAGFYVVCFPFVPLGFLLRDRMNVVLFANLSFLVMCIAAQSKAAYVWKKMHLDGDTLHVRTACKALCVALLVVCGCRNLLMWSDAPSPVVQNGDTTAVNLTTAIWTVHFGWDDYGVDSMQRLAKRLREAKVHMFGLLESDNQRVVNGNRDIVEFMAQSFGFRYTDYGPTTLDSTFGCALISQFPIRKVERMVLPSPMGELQCMIHAWVEVLPAPAPLVHVYVGHWGNTPHIQDLHLASHILGNEALKHEGPSVFLGYLVTHPGYKNYYRFVQSDGDAEDSAMRGTLLEGDDVIREEETKALPEFEDGVRLPRLPIVKKTSGLFRDVARDILRGRNPFSRTSAAQHEADRAADPLNSPWPAGSYWKVHAMPSYTSDESIEFEGRVGSARLREGFVTNLKARRLFEELSGVDAEKRHEHETAFHESPQVLSWSRLQRAAEYKARKMAARPLRKSLVGDAPEVLKPALRFLENTTQWNGRSSTSMIFEYPNTGRVSNRHPRHEYDDRYCQQVLYRSMPVLDWYRILEIDEESDTELQVVTFALESKGREPSV